MTALLEARRLVQRLRFALHLDRKDLALEALDLLERRLRQIDSGFSSGTPSPQQESAPAATRGADAGLVARKE